MQICLFGGAFDPPHLGHQSVAQYLRDKKICDEVWFVPVKQHPFGKKVEANGHRLTMLNFLLEPGFKIEEFELNHTGNSYSFQTLQALSQQYPEHQFSWVIGSDNLEKFHLWKEFEKLLETYTVYVYPREGSPFEPLLSGMVALKDAPLVTFSSTEVRKAASDKKPIEKFVGDRIAKYIEKESIYVSHS
jgi:nicotinate-nucleotide adenylyltransferase